MIPKHNQTTTTIKNNRAITFLARFTGQFFHFGLQQALSCVFPVAIFLTLAFTKWIEIPFLHRYDFVLLICILIQFAMYKTGLETKEELKIITVFHLIGLSLEIYKVNMGSWSYPEDAWTKIFGVPLYSGFMYASIASYMGQAWKRLNLRLVRWPGYHLMTPLAVAIYLNFYTHHFIYDLRWVLAILLFLVALRCTVLFDIRGQTYRISLVLSFFLIGFFIWLAENIATFLGAWQYPGQEAGWNIVHIGKISSWSLLVILSFIIVAQLKSKQINLHSHRVQ